MNDLHLSGARDVVSDSLDYYLEFNLKMFIAQKAHGDRNTLERRMSGRVGLDRSAHVGLADSSLPPRDDQLRTQTVIRVPGKGLLVSTDSTFSSSYYAKYSLNRLFFY